MADDDVLHTMGALSRSLRPGDLEETLRQVTTAAATLVPGADYANVTVRYDDGRLETVAPTHDLLFSVDAAQYDLQEGPCYEAATEEMFVTSPNLAADTRFPRYAPRALEEGIRAQAGLRLFDTPGGRARGALNLYSRKVGAFADVDLLAPLFAHQAAVALTYAQEVSDLRAALASRQQIGTAVGIAMERFGLDEQKAFGFLSRVSQDENVKLRDLATRLIADATDPD